MQVPSKKNKSETLAQDISQSLAQDESESLVQDDESETLAQDVLCAQQNTENADDNDDLGLPDVDCLRADQGSQGGDICTQGRSLLCSIGHWHLAAQKTIASTEKLVSVVDVL